MPSRPDLDHLRAEVAAALAAHDPVRARHAIRASAHHHAIEDGAGFRRLVTELPGEVWHDDAIVTAALGTSYRAPGSPQGGAALAYIEATERMLAEDAPVADRAAIMLAAGAALRTQGRLAEAAARLGGVSRLLDAASPGPLVIALSARHALETGVVDLLLGDLDDARRRLELAHGLSPSSRPASASNASARSPSPPTPKATSTRPTGS